MTTTDRLSLIRARCVELLEIASKRTPGKWEFGAESGTAMLSTLDNFSIPGVCDVDIYNETEALTNIVYISACAGAAEAGWKATIAAIDVCLEGLCYHQDMARIIISAWEGLA